MAELFCLSDTQWAAVKPLLPSLGGKLRVDDRRAISGILHRSGKGCVGTRCLTRMALARRRSTGSTVRASVGFGRHSLPPRTCPSCRNRASLLRDTPRR